MKLTRYQRYMLRMLADTQDNRAALDYALQALEWARTAALPVYADSPETRARAREALESNVDCFKVWVNVAAQGKRTAPVND